MSNPSIDDGGPAFPHSAKPMTGEATEWGMTLRDWFAGMALQGIAANPKFSDEKWTIIAKAAYTAADAMLSARKANQ